MNASCPSMAQLEEYVSGRLDGPAHGSIDDHVDSCITCQAALETLDDAADASFLCLRVAGGTAPVEEPEVRQLAARAKALHQHTSARNGIASPDTGGPLTAYQAEEVSAGRGDALRLGNYVLLGRSAGGMGAFSRRIIAA